MSFSEKNFISLNSRGLHKIVYNDWGQQNSRVIVCVHGLTGNGHDFDFLAQDLVYHGYRLVCVDLPGRGRSDFLSNPMDYNYTQYFNDIITLLAHLNITEPKSIDWIGISLGGLLGIHLASLDQSPIARLILNDVGPVVPQNALDFIHMIIKQEYRFETIKDLENRMRQTRGLTWGPVTDEQWHHMAEHNARALVDGRVTYAYDPEIAVMFENQPIGAQDLWLSWDKITCPVKLIWGAESMILTEQIVKEMETRGPGKNMDIVIFEDCGHVPSLMAPEHISSIREWLQKTSS